MHNQIKLENSEWVVIITFEYFNVFLPLNFVLFSFFLQNATRFHAFHNLPNVAFNISLLRYIEFRTLCKVPPFEFS